MKLTRFAGLFVLLFAATSIAACAMPAQVDSMIGTPTVQLLGNSPLKQSLRVNPVSGGQSTNPLWTSQVGNPEFQEALRQSLSKQGIVASNEARYQLDTVLVELKQPLIGLDLTVASAIHYTIREITTLRSDHFCKLHGQIRRCDNRRSGRTLAPCQRRFDQKQSLTIPRPTYPHTWNGCARGYECH